MIGQDVLNRGCTGWGQALMENMPVPVVIVDLGTDTVLDYNMAAKMFLESPLLSESGVRVQDIDEELGRLYMSMKNDSEERGFLYQRALPQGGAQIRKIQPVRLQCGEHQGVALIFEKEPGYAMAAVHRQIQDSIAVQENLNQALEKELLENRRMEKALEESEKHYRKLFDTLVTGYAVHEMIWDENGVPIDYRFLDMNPAFEVMTGLSRTQAIGKTVLELMPKTEGYWIESYAQVVRTGEPIRIENYAHAIGKYFEVLAFRPQENQFSVMVTDVTEKKKTEQALYQQKHIFEALFKNSPIAAVHFDQEHRVVEINRAFRRLFRYTPEEVRGIDVDSLIASEDQWAEVGAYSSEVLSGNSIRTRGWRKGKLGNQILADIIGIPIVLENEVTGGFALYTDITESEATRKALVKAKEAAEAANETKTQFLANMSHEIRTPMNGLLGMLQLLQTTEPNEEQLEYLRLAQTSGEGLLNLVNDIIDYSRLEAGRIVLNEEPFDIIQLVNDQVSLFQTSAVSKGLSLNASFERECMDMVVGDSLRIRQILSNLIGNAVKFTQRGWVSIDVRLVSGAPEGRMLVRFVVTDTGIGIPADKRDLLFKRFVQVDDSTTKAFGGVGLGLAISKGLVELMGGTISLGESLEGGCVFQFTLPLKKVV